MTKKEYLELQKKMWKVIEEKMPPAEFQVSDDDPTDFIEYLENRYIKMLAGLE